jgi:shikimate dehydrogenase
MLIEERITGKTRLIAVIGNPIEHSISPQLHNTLSKCLGLNLAYVPVKVEPDDIEDIIKGFRKMGFLGFNVTIPYKTEVIKHLDELSDEAMLTGAVNTVKFEGGRTKGYNTDGEGFLRSFKEETGEGFEGRNVVILGTGGAARAIAYAVAREGAKKLHILNRTVSNAESLCGQLREKIGAEVDYAGIDGREAEEAISSADVIINTTPVGMYPHADDMPLGENCVFQAGQIVYDIIYNPARTMLLNKAEDSGCMAVNGLGMLIHQGIAAYEIWTGIEVPAKISRILSMEFKNYMDK